MRYATDQAFRTALEARIKQGETDTAGVSRLRKRIVFERLLARLVSEAPGEWVLKGGFALELRLGSIARSTKDADFEWRLAEDEAVEMLLDAAALDLDEIATSNLLEFADIDGVEVPTLGIEQHLAEKLHAYTREYAGGRRSTRVKDLVDVVVIADTSVIDASKLSEAITVIFDRRGEHAVPALLPEPPAEWAGPWRRLARDVPANEDIHAGYRVAVALFDPILDRAVLDGTWEPDVGWRN